MSVDQERAWTPGRWRVEAQATAQAQVWLWGVHCNPEPETRGHDIVAWEIESKADAELIALAPELAEAVLAWADDWQRRAELARREHGRPPTAPLNQFESGLYDLAVRLRRIGGVR